MLMAPPPPPAFIPPSEEVSDMEIDLQPVIPKMERPVATGRSIFGMTG